MFGRFTLLSRMLTVTAVTVAAGACWSGAAGAATLTPPATGGPAGRHLSAGAPATVALTPVSVTAGSTGNSFTFTISAVAALSGHTRITIPATWPAPQASNAAGPGYVTAAKATCKSAAKPVVTGTGPWTISVAMNCTAGKHFTLTYGAGTGSARVQAPTAAGSYTFATAVKLGTATDPLSVPPVVVQPGPAADFVVSGLPRPSETGAPLPVTVTADDAFGNVATSYRGTVAFTSSDPGASLPGDYTFTAADSGTHTFGGGVTFLHEGTQSVTATDTDTASSSVTGSDSVPVNGVLFVSLNGFDTNPGTQAQPMGTVSAAVSKAAASSPPFAVDVAAGTYNEGAGVTVTGGITIEGGFDPSTWSHSNPETTTITGSPQAVYASAATGVLLDDLTLQGTAPTGAGKSAYGLLAVNNSSVTLTYVAASAKNGTTGQGGTGGTAGQSGQQAINGGNGQASGGCTSSFGSGGPGGTYVTPGGTGGTGGCSGGSGNSGGNGQTTPGGASGGAGGPGGAGDDQSQAAGGNGGTGTNGANGAPGTGAVNTLADAGITWAGATGGNGTSGQNAGGGGGGGGGGALTKCVFLSCTYNGGAGGGGGGGGGAGGNGGAGGASGGGSFGIYLWNSTATVQDYSTITAGTGGTGGTGGYGGPGGYGGEGLAGGQGINGSGTGGTGGWGGSGGTGGGGGGGAGGPSIGIFRGGSSTATTDATDIITGGTGGQGGSGGTGAGITAQSGQQGQSGAIVP
jgi:hypothetical protein